MIDHTAEARRGSTADCSAEADRCPGREASNNTEGESNENRRVHLREVLLDRLWFEEWKRQRLQKPEKENMTLTVFIATCKFSSRSENTTSRTE
jgi:hypothetical protein